tara:strand:+ start:1044 stop:1511 length:468 start_codon:yes stop_codon:yes gene_type:complete
MVAKNKHNAQLGSNIIRSDDRIRQTGEVFTPENEVHRMIDSLSEYEISNDIFLDYCAGNGNFSFVLRERGVPIDHIYGIEYMEDNFFELCDRLNIVGDVYTLVRHHILSDEYEEIKDSSGIILKKGNYLRCDVFFDDFQLLFHEEGKLGYVWVTV